MQPGNGVGLFWDTTHTHTYLVLEKIYVRGLGLEKKVLALALKNFHVLGLGLEKKVLALAVAS